MRYSRSNLFIYIHDQIMKYNSWIPDVQRNKYFDLLNGDKLYIQMKNINNVYLYIISGSHERKDTLLWKYNIQSTSTLNQVINSIDRYITGMFPKKTNIFNDITSSDIDFSNVNWDKFD